ncbi:MAG: NAD(P)/FAD-dependent oxidoreductase [Candidatus Heimdallarchaeota archaeon]|nr:MAG: NAD(P)/FAD-dependent oxidoreductase [Candidatus Heimdallarchaeota archaeon]
MTSFDVIVVGGGPTGLSAAITTARKGLNTLVLEEHPEIGHPLACGEGISADKLFSLENMPKPNENIDKEALRLQNQGSFVERAVNAQRFFFGTKGVATANISTFTINRPLFDKFMAKNAQQTGVELLLKTQVIAIERISKGLLVKTTNKDHTANIVIGCDGPSSHTVRMMGLHPPAEYVQGVEYKIQGIYTDALDFYFNFKKFPSMHYGWVFPKKLHTNIGVVVKPASKPMQILREFIKSLNNKEIESATVVQKIAGIIPASGPIPKNYSANFMAAGDAAGLTNTIFYGGISIGIHSGMLAGQVAIEAHEMGKFNEEQMVKYHEKCQSSPYTDPIIQHAHDILYNKFTANEVETFGSWVDGWDITTLNTFQKTRLFLKALLKPTMLKKFRDARIIAHGFSKSRDWGF